MSDPDQPEQQSLFLERYAPTTVAIFLRLTEANARSFAIASALGRILNKDGTFGPLKTSENGGGVFIGPTQLKRVLAILNIKPRRWQTLVTDWETRYVAHRCYRDAACLFTRPLQGACPKCKTEILVLELAPDPAARRHRSALVRPPKRTTSALEAHQHDQTECFNSALRRHGR